MTYNVLSRIVKYAARATLIIVGLAVLGVSTGVLTDDFNSTTTMICLILGGLFITILAVFGFLIYRSLTVRPVQMSLRRKLTAKWAALDPNDPDYAEKKFQLSKASALNDLAAAEGRRDLVIAYTDWVLKYPPNDVESAVATLRYMGVKNAPKRLTAEHLDVVSLLSQHRDSDASEQEWLAINRYAFENPGDAHDMEFVLSRGITDLREIVEMIDDLRTLPSPALVDGAL